MTMTLMDDQEFLAFMRSLHRMTEAEHQEFNERYGVVEHDALPTPPEELIEDHSHHNGR